MAEKKKETKDVGLSKAELEVIKAEIKAELMREMEEEPVEEVPEIVKERLKENEEMVTIRLFKDAAKYKDDVFVSINGQNWQIKRGVDVQVPKKVALVIRDSDIQRGLAADYMDSLDKPNFDNL